MFLKHFKMDVARWIVPQQVADLSEVTLMRTLKLLWTYLPLQAMLWFRIAALCKRHRIPLAGVIQRMLFIVYGLEIVAGADIGGGLYIAHPVGTVISPEKLGDNCSIIANVTIGMRNEWKFPRIGNNVFIGAGARVLGGIEIGDGAIIGANAVVIHDAPAGATLVGIPARVIRLGGQPVKDAAGMQEKAAAVQVSELV
jgi:serine O-acetyltransferase